MDINKESLKHVYKLLEEDRFVEAVEIYIHKNFRIQKRTEKFQIV